MMEDKQMTAKEFKDNWAKQHGCEDYMQYIKENFIVIGEALNHADYLMEEYANYKLEQKLPNLPTKQCQTINAELCLKCKSQTCSAKQQLNK